MVFTVRLSRTTSRTVRVRWRTADRTAVSGADYVAASGILFIPARARSGKIEVRLEDDALDEEDETFALEFERPVGASLADQPGDRNDRRR